MLPWLRRFAAFFGLTVLILGGCTRPETADVSGDVQVLLPAIGADGKTTYEVRTLSGVTDLSSMQTRSAQFHYAPKITTHGLEGLSVHTHFFRNEAGVYVPTDATTQNVLKIAFELEALSQLDERMGTHNLLAWPESVGYSVQMLSANVTVENNSFYDSGSKSILFVPFSGNTAPMSLNAGVIAHEHFHAIFDQMVMQPLISADAINPDLRATGDLKKIQRSVVVKGINEGLADVWGWIHSGDLAFIGKSAPTQTAARELKIQDDPRLLYNHKMSSRSKMDQQVVYLKETANPSASFNSYGYAPGTQLSRVVLDIFPGTDAASREDLGRRLVKALPEIAQKFKSDETTEVELTDIVRSIVDALPVNADQASAADRWIPKKAAE